MKITELINDVGIEAALKHLQDDLFIKVKEYDNFYKLNYDQIFSPKANPLVVECRALLLDKEGDVVSRAFPRFFNYGEQPEITNNFVWENSVHYSKEDGSLISVYWNYIDQRWEIATRGTAFAESEQDFYPSFRQAVLEDGFGMTEEEFQNFFTGLNYGNTYEKTYCFEYVSMKNRSALMFTMRKTNKSFEDVWNEYRVENRAEMISNRVEK